jgi:hypothetical protein
VTDATRFEAQLKAEGYPEMRFNQYKPNQHNALVLEGEITLTVDGKATRYAVGDVEDIGPHGVRYIVGRWPK